MKLFPFRKEHEDVLEDASVAHRDVERSLKEQRQRLDHIAGVHEWAREFLHGPDSPNGNPLEPALLPPTRSKK